MRNTIDRRKLLLTGAAAAASPLAAQEQEIRTAHIGVGVRGGSLLKEAVSQQRIKISAICDIDGTTRDKALSVAARDNPKSLTEWRAVLDLKDVDAVFIGTPCDMHAEMAVACLEAGKYVYCEKPLGITPESVDRVLKAARRSKTFLQIGQQLRYFPSMREAIRQVHDGIVGKSYIIKAHRHDSRSRPKEGAPQPTPQQATRTAWYADVKHSGD